MLRATLLIATLMVSMGAAVPAPYLWGSSDDGKLTEAVFAGLNGQKVYLRKTKDASVIEVPLVSLSEEDRRFITERSASSQTIKGKVVHVFEGDTIEVLEVENGLQHRYRIRLAHTDSPEPSQEFAESALKALTKRIGGRQVRVVWCARDSDDRILGDVYLGKHYVNGEMISDGLAWHCKSHSKSAALADFECHARKGQRGLWRGGSPVPPWDFSYDIPADSVESVKKISQFHSSQVSGYSGQSGPSDNDSTALYVTRMGKKYHRGSCRHLSKSKIPISLEEAKKRYSPCKVCKP